MKPAPRDAMRLPRATILMYHRVGVAPDVEEGDYVVPTTLFEDQMRLLAARGRPVVSLASIAEGRYPDRSVALTFDDGCDTDATVVAPILRGAGFTAAFFVNPALVGQDGRVSWAQLRALADEGFLVGSHGLDHALLDDVPAPELVRQIVESKRWLEARLERPVGAISLPGGGGGQRALRAAREAGYHLILGSRPGRVRGPAGRGILPRLAVRRGDGPARFEAALEPRPFVLLGPALRYALLRSARRVLGSRAYGTVRLRWLLRSAPPGRS